MNARNVLTIGLVILFTGIGLSLRCFGLKDFGYFFGGMATGIAFLNFILQIVEHPKEVKDTSKFDYQIDTKRLAKDQFGGGEKYLRGQLSGSVAHVEDDFASCNPEDLRKFLNTELALKIERVLQKGEENALKMWQIKERIGYDNDRKIRLTIEAMRLSKEHLILSSSKGYWYSATPEEVRKWAEYMKSYIKDISHLTKSVEDAAVKQYGERYYQIPLFLSQ